MAAVALLLVPAAATAAKPKRVQVQLLAINDLHGHLDSEQSGFVSPTGDPLDRVPAGGAAYLATHLRELRARNRRTLLVGAGDLIGGSPLLSSLFHDEPTIELLNALHMSVSSVGNHEFDEGQAELLRMQYGGCHPTDGCGDGSGFAGARFPYLAANVIRASDRQPFLPPYAIREVGGVRIGFIGVTTRSTPRLLAPAASDGLRFRDEADVANRYARILERQGVHAIVLLMHEGGYLRKNELPLGPDECPRLGGRLGKIVRRTSPAIDLFVTGHSHAAYNCVIRGRRVTSAGAYGRLITQVNLTISTRTGDVQWLRARNRIVTQDVTPSAPVTALLSGYNRIADPVRRRLVGRLAEGAGRWRDSSGESRMGNLVADAQQASAKSAAAFVNGGSVRTGLPAGDISYGRAFTAAPYGTTLVTLSMSGSQIRELLRQQWCGREVRSILHVSSSVSYSWSRSAANALIGRPCSEPGDPVVDLEINGRPVQPWQAFRVTVNSSLASGGNRFFVLHTGTGPVSGQDDVDALADYLEPTLDGEPLVPPLRDRISVVP